MQKDYICDDRNILEDAQKIRVMTDEEFETYNEALRKKERSTATDKG